MGEEVEDETPEQLVKWRAEEFGCLAIRPADAPVGADRQVHDRGFVVQVFVPLLAHAQRRLGAQALDLGAGSRREDTHDGEAAGAVPHRLVVYDGEVADHRPGGLKKRHTAVALSPPSHEPLIVREEGLQPLGMVGHVAGEHSLARGAGQGDGKVGEKVAAPPDGARAKVFPVRAKLGHERVLHTERGSQVPH